MSEGMSLLSRGTLSFCACPPSLRALPGKIFSSDLFRIEIQIWRFSVTRQEIGLWVWKACLSKKKKIRVIPGTEDDRASQTTSGNLNNSCFDIDQATAVGALHMFFIGLCRGGRLFCFINKPVCSQGIVNLGFAVSANYIAFGQGEFTELPRAHLTTDSWY